jgi:hypothetical protein
MSFIEKVRTLLGFRAKGRDILAGDEGYQLREGAASYKGLFEVEKDDIGPENTYLWDVKVE